MACIVQKPPQYLQALRRCWAPHPLLRQVRGYFIEYIAGDSDFLDNSGMEPTRRQLSSKQKSKQPPAINTLEGHLFASAATKAARKFLQANPEGGKKTLPKLNEWNAAIDHLYTYPGDMKTFEGLPQPKGKHAKKGND